MKIAPLLVAMTMAVREGCNLNEVGMSLEVFSGYQTTGYDKVICSDVHKLVDGYLKCVNEKTSFEPLVSDPRPALSLSSLEHFHAGLIAYYKTRFEEGINDAVLEKSKPISELVNKGLFHVDVAEMGKVSFLEIAGFLVDEISRGRASGRVFKINEMKDEVKSYDFSAVKLPSSPVFSSAGADVPLAHGGAGSAAAADEAPSHPAASPTSPASPVFQGMKRSPTQMQFPR